MPFRPLAAALLALLLPALAAAQHSSARRIPTDAEQVRARSGSPLPRIVADPEQPSHVHVLTADEVAAVGPPPASFDPLVQWPHCRPIIGHVRNQGPCGDCWAYGGTQMMQDRFCVVTGNNDTSQLLSTEDVVACMDLFIGTPGQGCGGGDPINTYLLRHPFLLLSCRLVRSRDMSPGAGTTIFPTRAS